METKELILTTLKAAGKPLKSGEIADLAHIEKKEVDKFLKKLKDEDLIASPKRCYYSTK
ncbi:MAG: ArsR family transcriptional regulator [Bacteroidales bacterium]|jgi:predicted transcriptional regulator|nr:ArsR family transcriptional regulator [Bacteroidales bacterium]